MTEKCYRKICKQSIQTLRFFSLQSSCHYVSCFAIAEVNHSCQWKRSLRNPLTASVCSIAQKLQIYISTYDTKTKIDYCPFQIFHIARNFIVTTFSASLLKYSVQCKRKHQQSIVESRKEVYITPVNYVLCSLNEKMNFSSPKYAP